MYQNIPTKVLTGEVRLSYANLTTPKASQQGGDPKYSVTLLIPKTDMATYNDICASIQAAYDEGVTKKWGGAHPQPKALIYDGDGLRPSGVPFGDECKGCWVITASSKNKPQVVGIDNINCELLPQDVYSGMYARVTINFFAYDSNGAKGVGCGLGNVLKTRDGEPLSGGASAVADFEGLGQNYSTQSYPQQQPMQPVQPYPTQQPVQTYPPQYSPSVAQSFSQQHPAVNPITGQPW